MKRILLAIILCCAPAMFTGCMNQPAAVQHPGAVNSFDSWAFDILSVTQDSLENSIRPKLAAAKPEVQAKLNPIFNKTIGTLKTLQAAYGVYHNAAVGGASPDFSTLQVQITQLAADVAQLIKELTA